MATHSVSFTSSTEGITFGVHSDSFVGALSLLVEEFGEGVIPLYEHTRAEFVELCRAVEGAKTDASSLREQPNPADERGPVAVPEDDALSIFTQPEGGEDAGVRAAPHEGDGGEADSERASEAGDAPEEPVEAVQEQHVCVVCGAGVSADRAKATTLMQGEVRCPDCSTL